MLSGPTAGWYKPMPSDAPGRERGYIFLSRSDTAYNPSVLSPAPVKYTVSPCTTGNPTTRSDAGVSASVLPSAVCTSDSDISPALLRTAATTRCSSTNLGYV